MAHPIRAENELRRRKNIFEILRMGVTTLRSSNIVFVCGGNCENDMRRKFQTEFSELLPDYIFFEPEYAIESYFAMEIREPFDLGEFEGLIANLSASIVVFPEGPGSFAEIGYFANLPEISEKILLAIDMAHFNTDSFINLGPVKRIGEKTIFNPTMSLDYTNPNFEYIAEKITKRSPIKKNFRKIEAEKFHNLENFEVLILANLFSEILIVSTAEDIIFLFRSMFGPNVSEKRIRRIISISIGAGLLSLDDNGFLLSADVDVEYFRVKSGFDGQFNDLKFDMLKMLNESDGDHAEAVRRRL